MGEPIRTFFGMPIKVERTADILGLHKNCEKQFIETQDGDYGLKSVYCKTHGIIIILDEVTNHQILRRK